MSSRDIAQVTGKQHKHVLVDIRKMLDDLGKSAAEFSATALINGPNSSKRTVEVFNLPKKLVMNLCMGYSAVLRDKVPPACLGL